MDGEDRLHPVATAVRKGGGWAVAAEAEVVFRFQRQTTIQMDRQGRGGSHCGGRGRVGKTGQTSIRLREARSLQFLPLILQKIA